MNENENGVVIDDDNYDVDLSEYESMLTGEGEGSQTGSTEQQQEPDSESTQGEEGKQEEPVAKTDELTQGSEALFDLKHNKETKQYTRQQVTELAQKGLDYERVTGQRDRLQREIAELAKFRDENSGILEMLKSAAAASGKGEADFIRAVRMNALIAQGVSREVAEERILREDAERSLSVQQQKAEAAQNTQKETEQRQRDDIARFQKKYSDVDPKTIPQEVWDAVRSGELLTDAYGEYQRRELARQLREANEKLAAREKNEKNKQKTLGSLQSTAQATGKDLFLEGFLSDD